MQGKCIAVIGTGASGVQTTQELSQVVSHFVLFQRTPNTALPMNQINYTSEEQTGFKKEYPPLLAGRKDSCAGFDFSFLPRGTFDDTPERRRETYEQLWNKGGFHF